MSALQTNQPHVDHLSPKETLRAHVEHLPLEKQYEFVLTALNLISQRPAPISVDGRVAYQLSLPNRKHAATH